VIRMMVSTHRTGIGIIKIETHRIEQGWEEFGLVEGILTGVVSLQRRVIRAIQSIVIKEES